MMRRTLSVCLAVMLLPALAAAQAPAKQPPKQKPKKVWTNEDLEALRNRVRLSDFEGGAAPPPAESAPQAAPGEATAATGAAAAAAGPAYDRAKDPEWYRQRLAGMRAEVERIGAEISRLREARTRGTQTNVALGLGQSGGLSPEDQIASLERRRAQVQQQIDELEDQARRNGIEPSRLR